MKNLIQKFKGPLILLLTSIIWGTTFVAQSLGSDYVDAYTYCGVRFLISGIILLIFCLITDRLKKQKDPSYKFYDDSKKSKKWIFILSFFVGFGLAAGSVLQQLGLTLTKSPSKSGFISATYMLMVPVIGLIFKKKVKPLIWILLVVALTGCFLISYNGSMKFELGDLLTLAGALGFAIQITSIDLVIPYIDSVHLSCIQFLITGILSTAVAIIRLGINKTPFDFESLRKAMFAIVYAAILSGCIAYTFQIIGQKTTPPTIASMIMSLESVFALISGIIFLHEKITINAWIGSALVFVAIILSQIDFSKIKEKR